MAAFLLTVVGLVFWEARAGAVDLVDRDFSLRFGEGPGDVCVLVPESLWDAGACAGIDRGTLGVRATAVEADIVALAVLRQDGWGVVLAVVRDAASARLLDRRDATEWWEGLRKGIREGLAPDARFTLAPPTVTSVNGVSVVGTEMNVELPAEESSRGFLGYEAIDAVATRGDAYVLTFAAPPERAVDTKRVAAATLLTIRARPARIGESAYRLARLVAVVGVGIVAFPAALTALALLVRAAARARRAPRRVAVRHPGGGVGSARAPAEPPPFRVPPSLFTQRLRLAPDLALDPRSVPFRALVEGSRTLPSNPRNAAVPRPK
jgi:hypothetical protein